MEYMPDDDRDKLQHSFYQYGIPEKSFKPDLKAGQTIESLVESLNLYAEQPGEHYVISQDKD